MTLDGLFKILSISLIFLVACTSIENINTENSCILFKEKKSWYNLLKKVMKNGVFLYLCN